MTGRKVWMRRLAVVVLLIAVVVALGFLWRVSPLKGLVIDDHHRRGPGGEARPPGEGFRDRDGGGAFRLASLDDLVQTVLVGAGVLGVVVAVDKWRRRRRPVLDRAIGS